MFETKMENSKIDDSKKLQRIDEWKIVIIEKNLKEKL